MQGVCLLGYTGRLLASVSSYENRVRYGSTRRVCIKVFVPRGILEFRPFSGFGKARISRTESYDMLGISYDNHPRLKRI
ncbi:NAD(P)H-quinone oxidoreductase subunit J chloroplastic [Bienertia sinuspersici]